jgi:hypothetical protein
MVRLLLLLLTMMMATMATTTRAAVTSLFVDPGRGDDTNDGASASSALRTLASARQRVRQALSERPQSSIVVDLLPGRHRVPSGGFVLGAKDSPVDGYSVAWRGRPGMTSLSGGEPVSGWKLAGDPTLPKGVYAAPAPAGLRGSSARHMFVDGVRAVRTRRPATTALPGLALENRSECVACSYSVDNSSDVLAWSNPGDVELVYSGVLASWAEERCAVDSVGPSPPPPPQPPPSPAPAPRPGSCSGAIHIHHTQGCYNYSDWRLGDPGSVFPTHESAVDGVKLTLESCGAACYKLNRSTASLFAGVMDGSRCFCGTAADLTSAAAKARALPKGACETTACQGKLGERTCGGVGSMLVYAYSCDGAAAVAAERAGTNYSSSSGSSDSGSSNSRGSSVRITMKQPCFWNLVKGKPLSMGNTTQRVSRARPGVVFPIHVENVREHLSTPGQWYFDRAKQEVLYYPLVGQDLSKVEVILAVEETLVKHVGAQNHAWSGLTFEFGTWLRPMQGAGFVEEQTGAKNVFFLSPFILKLIISPRQARGMHRKR